MCWSGCRAATLHRVVGVEPRPGGAGVAWHKNDARRHACRAFACRSVAGDAGGTRPVHLRNGTRPAVCRTASRRRDSARIVVLAQDDGDDRGSLQAVGARDPTAGSGRARFTRGTAERRPPCLPCLRCLRRPRVSGPCAPRDPVADACMEDARKKNAARRRRHQRGKRGAVLRVAVAPITRPARSRSCPCRRSSRRRAPWRALRIARRR